MEETEASIIGKLERQKAFFSTFKTREIDFRLEQLHKLKKAIALFEKKIGEALWNDLHKSPEESYLTEISIVTTELDHHISRLKKWAKPKKVFTPLVLKPSTGKIIYEPLGVALIVAPWNYPFQLLINPLIGAISSGCCCILKPSPDAPAVAKVVAEMIAETFPADYISVVQGGRATNTLLFNQRFDIIFFTGSSSVGKVVMKAAAEHLTAMVLELGGKSPCIVDADANLDIAARRITWGKFINAGQTCIAPDYLLVHETVKEQLLSKIAENIRRMYGDSVKESPYYPRIINDAAMSRLEGLLKQGRVHTGGETDRNEKYIAPTLIDNIDPGSSIMQEEIFGPILPVITYKAIGEVIAHINNGEKPLAFYYFGGSEKAKEVLAKTTSGGACINDTLVHIANHRLPFGGVGNSGMGKYHGHESFLAFSNKRAVATTPTWFDLPLKYPPFKHFKWVKRMLK